MVGYEIHREVGLVMAVELVMTMVYMEVGLVMVVEHVMTTGLVKVDPMQK